MMLDWGNFRVIGKKRKATFGRVPENKERENIICGSRSRALFIR